MFPNTSTVKIELGINAQDIAAQVMFNNKAIETQIAEGIKLALDGLLENDSLVQAIKKRTEEEIGKIVRDAVSSYEIRRRINELLQSKMAEKLDEYVNQVVSRLTDHV